MSKKRRKRERDLERELRSHLESEALEHQESGLTSEAARYAARRALGNTTLLKETVHEMWGWTSLDRLGQDLRYGFRTLRRSPGFTAVAILALALGIGANSGMFSVLYGVLLRPLPYPEADRTALVYVRFLPQNAEYGTMSIADYLDWKARNHAFEDLAIFSNASWRFNLTGARVPLEVKGCAVTANFFSVLRSRPILGRVFDPDESAAAGGKAVVLSEPLWRRHFGADPAVIGQVLKLNGDPATIVGVMPASFRFPAGEALWTNIRLKPPTRRGPFPFIGIARLKRGVSFEQAQVETNSIGRQIETANPGNYRRMSMPLLPLREALAGNIRPALVVLAGAVFFVLLIAAVNVASLMLVRANTREREMAVRLTLGAARGRLLRQLLTESLLLAVTGGAAGLALAWLAIGALRAWNPGNLPRIEDVHLDFRVLVFTFFLSLITGVVFGLAPALRSSRAELHGALKQGGRSATASRASRRTQSALVVVEFALSFSLLVGAGLLLRSFVRLQAVAAGFRAPSEQVLTTGIAPSRVSDYRPRYGRILERVRHLPGVTAAALSDSLPPDRRADYDTFQIEGKTWTESAFPAVTEVIVSPGYFQTLRIPLLEGRYFAESDTADGAKAIVISESLARRYFQDVNPIGHRIAPSGPDNHNGWLSIVGVVGDVKYTGLASVSEPAFYVLYTEFSGFQKLHLLVQSSIASGLAPQIERAIRVIDHDATLSDVATLDAATSQSMAQPRFRTVLIAVFAGVALLLSAVGIYGVIAYSVTQRTNEIGIRMALGAKRSAVLKQIAGQGIGLALMGVAIGYAGALLLTRALASLLFRTSLTDPLTFVSVSATLVAVALAASAIPARRATQIDPITALRYE